VSINTQLSSFLYRHTGEDGDDADLDDPSAIDDPKKAAQLAKKKKKKKKNKDLQLNQVENLKSNLEKHLVEINNLFGRRRNNNDQLFTEDADDGNSSDSEEDDALAKQLAALKKLLFTNEAILKGHDNEDLLDDADKLEALLEGDGKESPDEAMAKLREERQRQEQEDIDKLNAWNEGEDAKFEQNMDAANEKILQSLFDKNDTVLQQQIQSA